MKFLLFFARPFNDRENNLDAVLCIDMEGKKELP